MVERKTAKMTCVLCFWGLSVCVAVFCSLETAVCGREICETIEEVQFCVEKKGPCDLYHLVPREKSNVKMDMMHVSILNHSNGSVKIIPENFYGITEDGLVIAMDPPFYASIELKTKLRARELPPRERMGGFLFFPTSFGMVRTLVHDGDPFIEMLLY
ncbi:MAG: hypothetical protein AB2L12_00150 [Smithellaceae bacterium]